jgi:hypothetical protein
MTFESLVNCILTFVAAYDEERDPAVAKGKATKFDHIHYNFKLVSPQYPGKIWLGARKQFSIIFLGSKVGTMVNVNNDQHNRSRCKFGPITVETRYV